MANIIPAASSGFETGGSTGNWVLWFACTVAQTTAEAADGTGSMQVTCTDAFAGIQLSNWPGWAAAASTQYTISAKIKGPTATWTFTGRWRNEAGTDLATFTLAVNTTAASFTSNSTISTSPSGTTRLWLECSSNGTVANTEVFYFDSIVADDAPPAGAGPVYPTMAPYRT